ncbi:hypothetical protein ABE10_11005 [Bacillus toyonensis]|nr:hypothetical protein [Bacillus toyonensis]
MRRRKVTSPLVEAAGLRPAPLDDPSGDYETRKTVMDEWLTERSAWVARREQHAAAHGWPGGEHGRFVEEDRAHPVPDYPFDPAWEIAAGNL